ncbi:rod-binding protein [Serpentinicella sp. ANB-PHB4]|uniref:rod-binding protein n=1 Tax=Serpentinicella sp. ANB-PHB4 TaxID=3074076 RepID=UPI0028591C75|nr:rod-binding protein [Serpentinicella sp. ANB-PHB4]MDR5659700.1 rod-binding protein [Serpentinicella sp. ANB-PHB4]
MNIQDLALQHMNKGINGKSLDKIDDREKLMDACREFEAIFLNMMMKEMRKTIPTDGLTEKSQAREIFESMHDEKLSVEMARGKGTGLAKQLYNQLSRSQERGKVDGDE